MARDIVPMHELEQRMPEQGRIRMGEKQGGGGRPVKLSRFRFTSQDRDAIEKIAELYGGQATQWRQAPTGIQWQVTITDERVPIVLPADPMGGTPIYETWSKGGIQRRCDGKEAEVPVGAGDQARLEKVPCLCFQEEILSCKPKSRLNVVLRDVPFAGTWRLESNGWYVAHEMPGMVAMIQAVQNGGLVQGYLKLEERAKVFASTTRKFMVPVLGLPESVAALAEGTLRLQAIAQLQDVKKALHTAHAELEPEWDEADVVDVEIVDEPEVAPSSGQSPQLKAMHAGIRSVVELPEIRAADLSADDVRHALALRASSGGTSSSKQLTADQLSKVLRWIEHLLSGEQKFLGLTDLGAMRLSTHKEA